MRIQSLRHKISFWFRALPRRRERHHNLAPKGEWSSPVAASPGNANLPIGVFAIVAADSLSSPAPSFSAPSFDFRFPSGRLCPAFHSGDARLLREAGSLWL